jgi:RNA polymerase sigma factor (sigma-70 family)
MDIRRFWEKTYKKNAPMMLGVCMRYVKEKEVAEDLMQESFATAIRRFDTYTGKGPVEGWLRKIAINTALMFLRSESARKVRENLWSEHAGESREEEQGNEGMREVIAGAGFTELELLQLIDALPHHHRMVFNLYVLDRYTHEEIGRELNIAPGTSKSHLARARKKLQELLYAKALEKQEVRKRSKVMVMLSGFFGTADVDRIFSRGLEKFAPVPENTAASAFRSIRWDHAGLPAGRSFATRFGWKYSRRILWTAGIAAVFLAIPLYRSIKSEGQQKAAGAPAIEHVRSLPANTAQLHGGKDKPPQNVDLSSAPEPVIVHKTLVRHVVYVVRDTVKIADTGHGK